MKREKVIISESTGDDLKELIASFNYDIINVNNFDEALHSALKFPPSLIIGDFSTFDRSVNEVCSFFKQHVFFRHIPVIIVSDNNSLQARIKAAESGASDYILKPFEKEEVVARINRSIRDMKNALNANPLTRLPGNLAIQDRLETVITDNENYAVAYFDLDNFKSYNDSYGYAAGDKIISETSNLILDCREYYDNNAKDIFVGHIGGDDFLVVAPDSLIEEFCERFITRFDRFIKTQYDKDTAERGFMIGRDRQGKTVKFPLVSVSIAIVVNEGGEKYQHVGEIAGAGAEIKKYLKGLNGSNYLVDRRS